MKRMTVDEFYRLGFLQELNRNFLHPLGLALAVEIGTKEGQPEPVVSFGQIWDNREDPEGMTFSEADLESPEFRAKAESVYKLRMDKARARRKSFGWVVQQVPLAVLNSLPHTVEEDFMHFLSYSGLHAEPAEQIVKLRMAFEAAWEQKTGWKAEHESLDRL